MTKEKVRSDASSSVEGTLYQFYIAVDKCFDMEEGESVVIEKEGDISVSAKQIEVKKYSDSLTDSHINIWNTLANWIDEKFDISKYRSLILMTTQQFGAQSNLKNWNETSVVEKVKTLADILEKAEARFLSQKEKEPSKEPSEVLSLMRVVMDAKNADRLNEIVTKFIILDASLVPADYYEKIKNDHLKLLNKQSHERVLNSLLGFILSPKIVLNAGWEIKYEDFKKECEDLNARYALETKKFPSVKHSISEKDRLDYDNYLFVRKIKEIEHLTEVDKAITHYCVRQKFITEELGNRLSMKEDLDLFDEDLVNKYEPQYSTACLSTSPSDIIKDSKIFYNRIMSDQVGAFAPFTNPSVAFRNGSLHDLANDGQKNVVWKLKCME